MTNIRNLFEPTRQLDRRIEKVISFESDANEQLKSEISEYVATESIETSLERLLSLLQTGMSGGSHEVGIWVSGFYGSGKSSFTKYFGFALDPQRKIDDKPFLEWFQNRLDSQALRTQLGTLSKRFPSTVIMIDLASAQMTGATMAEISSVLYWTVMHWAGYPKDKKVAYLQMMLERDGKMPEFEQRIQALAKGKTWKQIQNQPLVVTTLATKLAREFYPEIFSDEATFARLKLDEAEYENKRVEEMIDLVRRKSGRENVIFILDEVGQYIGARDNLILNLDGLAKNIKHIGNGKAWLIATAQQTLTEDDPRAQRNSGNLSKLSARFPISIDLEASDIREICYKRLLAKSPAGEANLKAIYKAHGEALRHHTQLQNSRYYQSHLDESDFTSLYPFLPQHFDILLELLGRLAKTSGGIGLRSVIKIIQDVLVDQSGMRPGHKLLADEAIGTLATAEVFYDTLRQDIARSFKHITEGVERVSKSFGATSMHLRVAKAIAVLQVLEDFPISRENIAAMLHSHIEAASLLPDVKAAVDEMLQEVSVHLSEIDGRLRFMSEAVAEMEAERAKIVVRLADTRKEFNERLAELFEPAPSVKLKGTRTVTTGIKTAVGSQTVSLAGDKEAIQTVIEWVPALNYDQRRDDKLIESNQRLQTNTMFLLAREDPDVGNLLDEIVRCRGIYNQNRNKTVEKEVGEYLNGQLQRADTLIGQLDTRLKKQLLDGSFIFRGKPVAVAELAPELFDAISKRLEGVAEDVFDKYAQAPHAADGGLAERFLNTQNLAQIASKDDPLSLVKKTGRVGVDMSHRALVSIRDYLEKNGSVDGRKLMDDFFDAPYGWSKDTTRYLVAALLTAGEIKLRIAGADVVVRGESAKEALKNTVNFAKAGISLRDVKVSLDAKRRASDRLLTLTGETVMPLEDEISKAVMKHFPSCQQLHAPLATQLTGLDLPGVARAEALQNALVDILRGDASEATTFLGGEQSELFDNMVWAGQVKKAFDNGIGKVAEQLHHHINDIALLPDAGALSALKTETETARAEAQDFLSRETFFKHQADLQHRLTALEVAVAKAVKALQNEQDQTVEGEKAALQSSAVWSRIGQEEQATLSMALDGLSRTFGHDLQGLRQILGYQYELKTRLESIKARAQEIAQAVPEPPPLPAPNEVLDVQLVLPSELASPAEADVFIAQLENLKAEFARYGRIRIQWSEVASLEVDSLESA